MVSAEYMTTYTCHKCIGIETHALPRARLESKLADATGTFQGAFYGPDVEELMGVTAYELFRATEHGSLSELAPRMKEAARDAQKLYVRIYEKFGEIKYIFSFPAMVHANAEPLLLPLPGIPDMPNPEQDSSASITPEGGGVEKETEDKVLKATKKRLDFNELPPLEGSFSVPSNKKSEVAMKDSTTLKDEV